MITYFDTSVLLKLVVEDEDGVGETERLWQASTVAICAEIAYAEGRAALAAAHRARRLSAGDLAQVRSSFETIWRQLHVVTISTALIAAAGDIAEDDRLRGYDAVHLAAAMTVGPDVFTSADGRLCDAASQRGFNVANPVVH